MRTTLTETELAARWSISPKLFKGGEPFSLDRSI
jgi:hypothetical protein